MCLSSYHMVVCGRCICTIRLWLDASKACVGEHVGRLGWCYVSSTVPYQDIMQLHECGAMR